MCVCVRARARKYTHACTCKDTINFLNIEAYLNLSTHRDTKSFIILKMQGDQIFQNMPYKTIINPNIPVQITLLGNHVEGNIYT